MNQVAPSSRSAAVPGMPPFTRPLNQRLLGADASSEDPPLERKSSAELLQPREAETTPCAERLESLVFWVCATVAYLAAAVWVTDEFMPDKELLPEFLKPVDETQRRAKYWSIGVAVALGVLLCAALARRRHCRFWELVLPFLFRRTEHTSTLAAVSYRSRMCMGYLWAFIMLASLLSLPFVVYVLVTFHQRLHHVAVLVSFVFAFLATTLSVREIMKHLTNYSSPRLQLHYIRILWMVPIYALTAAATLRFEQKAILFNAAREA